MNDRRLAYVSLGLWVVTVLTVAIFFIRGHTAPSSDARQAILLSPAERDAVLTEMRAMLASVQGVLQGVRARDARRVAVAARASGMQVAVDLELALMAKLPLEFKQLGTRVHKGFDAMAVAAEKGATPDVLLGQLDVLLGQCVACHAGYRLEPKGVK